MPSADPPDPINFVWRVAQRCDGGSCLRVAASKEMVVVGDSKNPDGPVLTYTQAAWRMFTAAAKNGVFDYGL